MNRIKTLAAFVALAALGRAESVEFADRVIQLPSVVVEATRLPNPVIDVRPALDEARAQANLATRIDMRRTLGRSFRHLAADQRRTAPAVGPILGKPNA
jgi:hypothetical protein